MQAIFPHCDDDTAQAKLKLLDPLTYVILSSRDSAEEDSKHDTVDSFIDATQLPTGTAEDHIQYLHSLISLTLYACTERIDRLDPVQTKSITRILGYCHGDDISSYIGLLMAWLATKDVIVTNLSKTLDKSPLKGAPIVPHKNYRDLVFGLPFSWRFHPQTEGMQLHTRPPLLISWAVK